MKPAFIELDFVKQKRRASGSGVVLLIAGLLAVYWIVTDYQASILEVELLDIQLARYSRDRDDTKSAFDPAVSEQIQATAIGLSTPWSALLDDLEHAIADSGADVALLQVAPDLEKRQVSIVAETRTLPAALAYVERLQGAAALQFPTLQSHEVRIADRQRPVRVEISAEWGLP
jgi:hypothetical protein